MPEPSARGGGRKLAEQDLDALDEERGVDLTRARRKEEVLSLDATIAQRRRELLHVGIIGQARRDGEEEAEVMADALVDRASHDRR